MKISDYFYPDFLERNNIVITHRDMISLEQMQHLACRGASDLIQNKTDSIEILTDIIFECVRVEENQILMTITDTKRDKVIIRKMHIWKFINLKDDGFYSLVDRLLKKLGVKI
jgi:hypothetical protein